MEESCLAAIRLVEKLDELVQGVLALNEDVCGMQEEIQGMESLLVAVPERLRERRRLGDACACVIMVGAGL